MAPNAPRAAWLGRRMWEEGQLLGGGNRPESRKVGPSLGSASGGQGWWAGRSVPFLHPSPALGSGPPPQPPQPPPPPPTLSCTPSAKWTSRPPAQLRGISVGVPKAPCSLLEGSDISRGPHIPNQMEPLSSQRKWFDARKCFDARKYICRKKKSGP